MAESLELVPFRRLIDDVLEAVKASWARFAPAIGLPLIACGMLTIVFQRQQVQMQAASLDPNAIDPSQFFSLMLLAFVILFVLIASYGLIFDAALVAAVGALETGRLEIGRAWWFVLRPDMLIYQALIWGAIFFSVMLCFLPSLFVAPLLVLVIPILYNERLSLPAAIQRNADLVRFNPTGRMRDSGWLQVLAVLALGVALSYAITFVVQLPFSILQMFVLFRQGAFEALGAGNPEAMIVPLWLQLPMIVISALGTTFAWLYWVYLLATLYRELRRRQEGDDLQAAIDEITGRAAVAVAAGTGGIAPAGGNAPGTPPVEPFTR